MGKLNSISPSQLTSMECRLQWYWGTEKGYRPQWIRKNLDLGSAVHVWMENFYIPNHLLKDMEVRPDPFEKMQEYLDKRKAQLDLQSSDDLFMWSEMSGLAHDLMKGYVAYYGSDPYREWEVLDSEKTLYYPVPHPITGEPTPYRILARLDGIVRDKNLGTLHALEHKTYTTFDRAHFAQDHQFTAQMLVGRDLDITSVIYNGIRKQRPGPRVRNAIYQREDIYRNKAQLSSFLIRAYYTAEQFYGNLRDHLQIYPEPEKSKCARCDFRTPCKMYMEGISPKEFLSKNYKVERYTPTN